MHYIKDGPFEGHKKITDQTIGEVLADFAGAYQPIGELSLKTNAEIRTLNKGVDILEAGPEDGYFFIEQDDVFKMLQNVTTTMIRNSTLARAAPYVEDLFLAALTEKPETKGAVTPIREAVGD